MERGLWREDGGTRLYRSDAKECVQISEDDSQVVVRRGQDGKPLISGGAAVVQRGITNAVGSGEARVTVQSCELPAGGALVLASDGFYGCSLDFLGDIQSVCSHGDLDDALAILANDYGDRIKDDATVVVLRRAFRALTKDDLDQAIAGQLNPAIPVHAIASAIGTACQNLSQLGE